MIQFNLLPDIKLAYIRATRLKRLVIVVAAGITAFIVTITLLLFLAVAVFQKKHLNDLSRDIKRDSATLQNIPDLNKILTVQNQLNSLPALHAQKPVTTRLTSYLTQIIPAQVSVAKLDIDFTAKTIAFTGAADSLGTVNKFVDTLKFTEYQTDANDTGHTKAFSQVVLSSFGRDDKGASYEIKLAFDPAIFDGNNNIKLSVPNITSSRSETEKPADLFQPLSDTKAQ